MACSSNPCQNGGTCVDFGLNSFRCNCVQWFTGSICEGNVYFQIVRKGGGGGKKALFTIVEQRVNINSNTFLPDFILLISKCVFSSMN